MASYTLTYSEGVAGWVSFYSYYPDYMVGMNNYFYTFKGGNLYRHSVNSLRNTFYEDWFISIGNPSGAFTPSSIQSVLNQSVLENKLFKTIDIRGDAAWEIQLQTDLQNSGFIELNWFQRKEATYFAFIRNNSNGQFPLRSLNGIGNSTTVTGSGTIVNFSISPLISVGDIISIGDFLYFLSGTTPLLAGVVTAINVNYPAGINNLVINNSVPDAEPIPTDTEYFLYIKNSVAESHGVLGHYCKFTMQNTYSNKIELFTLGSDVMKSFP